MELEEENTSKISWLQGMVFWVKDKIIQIFQNGEKLKKKKEILAQIGMVGKLYKTQETVFL